MSIDIMIIKDTNPKIIKPNFLSIKKPSTGNVMVVGGLLIVYLMEFLLFTIVLSKSSNRT